MVTLRQRFFAALGGLILAAPLHAQDAAPPTGPGFAWSFAERPMRLTISPEWYISNFAIQHGWINTIWDRRALSSDDGALVMRLSPTVDPARTDGKDFAGAEAQRRTTSGYGRYEVVMTPSDAPGAISTFFTYTGPWFGKAHDEIDIEFLGTDTTKVWVKAFADGAGLPGKHVDLGFDAADGPQLYSFEWTPEMIVWYARGDEIHRILASDTPLPTTPGKIYLNLWTGGPSQADWAGVAADDTDTTARYYCLSYQELGKDTPQCSQSFLVD